MKDLDISLLALDERQWSSYNLYIISVSTASNNNNNDDDLWQVKDFMIIRKNFKGNKNWAQYNKEEVAQLCVVTAGNAYSGWRGTTDKSLHAQIKCWSEMILRWIT